MAKLYIKNLRIKTTIGVFPHERKKKQLIFLNFRLEFNSSHAETSDDINDTVNYDTLTKKITDSVNKMTFHLLEALARHIMSLILKDRRITRAVVEIIKPSAIKNAKSVSFMLSRENK